MTIFRKVFVLVETCNLFHELLMHNIRYRASASLHTMWSIELSALSDLMWISTYIITYWWYDLLCHSNVHTSLALFHTCFWCNTVPLQVAFAWVQQLMERHCNPWRKRFLSQQILVPIQSQCKSFLLNTKTNYCHQHLDQNRALHSNGCWRHLSQHRWTGLQKIKIKLTWHRDFYFIFFSIKFMYKGMQGKEEPVTICYKRASLKRHIQHKRRLTETEVHDKDSTIPKGWE